VATYGPGLDRPMIKPTQTAASSQVPIIRIRGLLIPHARLGPVDVGGEARRLFVSLPPHRVQQGPLGRKKSLNMVPLPRGGVPFKFAARRGKR